jgi:RNA recognition motif-containing protein
MQGRNIMGSEIKIQWAQTTSSSAAGGAVASTDATAESICVFVGNLNPDMDEKEFRNAFTPFGCIDARMITEPGNPHKKLHYGFVDFNNKVRMPPS